MILFLIKQKKKVNKQRILISKKKIKKTEFFHVLPQIKCQGCNQ